jgi:hypothetical protein
VIKEEKGISKEVWTDGKVRRGKYCISACMVVQ